MGIGGNRPIAVFPILILTAFAFSLVYFQISIVPFVQASPATITLEPIADAYVDSDNPDLNYGGAFNLDVQFWDFEYIPDVRINSYLMFDLSGIPTGSLIDNARLELYAWSAWSPTPSVGIHYSSDISWTEIGITWNNAPSFSLTPTHVISVPYDDQWYSWDITNDVRTALPTKKLSVVMKVQNTGASFLARFYSKEAYDKHPRLVINYTTPKASSSISCSASSSSIASGESITVSGSISPSHTGVTVTLTYTRPNGALVTRTVTATAGSYSDTYIPDMAGAWNVKASWDGDEDHLGATSSTVSFTVKAPSSVSCSTSPTSITIGQTVTVSGSITPARSGVTVTLTYTRPNETTFTRAVTTATGGSYTDDYTPDQAGPWKVKASWSGDENYAGSESSLVSFNVSKLSSSITCSTSPTSITMGQTITVSGSITPARSGITITLTYIKPDGIALTRTAITATDGSYSDSYAPDRVGSWEVKAGWPGNENYAGSESSFVTFSVAKASSSITCSASPISITIGQTVTVSGTLTPARSGITILLTYTRPVGTTITRTVTTTTGGSYSDVYTPDQAGSWNVKAGWLGDENYTGSESAWIPFNVVKASSTISASISPTSITIGQTITVSGTLTLDRSGIAVTLTYTKPDGSTFTRTITTAANGSYTYNHSPDKTGSWKVKASWLGDENYTGSESSLISYNVGKLSSSITCLASSDTIKIGQTVATQGTITPARSGITISLTYTKPDGTTLTRTATTTTDGSYGDSYTPDRAGSWKVKADWSGNENYTSSESSLITFSVAKLSSSITRSVSSDKIEKGRSITISGSISPPLAGVIVTLTYEKPYGSTITRTVTSSADGSFEDSYTPKELGIWKVTASWLGDENHEGETSSPVTFMVEESSIVILALGAIVIVTAIAAVLFFVKKRSTKREKWELI